MVTMCHQLKRRFNLQDHLWRMCSFLSPKCVLDVKSRILMPSLSDLVKALPCIHVPDIHKLDNEWRDLYVTPFPPDMANCDILEFYKKLSQITDNDGVYQFNVFCNFAMHVLSLPTSNADAEILFSKLSLMKTKTRNRLQLPSISALILISEAVKDKGGCMDFRPSERMLNSIK